MYFKLLTDYLKGLEVIQRIQNTKLETLSNDTYLIFDALKNSLGRFFAKTFLIIGTTDHKQIAKYYFYTGIYSGVVGAMLSVFIRIQLSQPGQTFLKENYQMYNNIITAHGIYMIFFMLMPLMLGFFGNFFVPILIGAADMCFPRLNAASYWLLFASICCFNYGQMVGEGSGTGWTIYPPLSTSAHPGWAVDYTILSLHVAGISSLVGSINFMCTIADFRGRGIYFSRMSLFVWSVAITSFLLIASLPVLAVGLTFLIVDRRFSGQFYEAEGGGDPVLYQHLFWFFGRISLWPIYTVKYIMHDAICWNFMLELSSYVTIYPIIRLTFITNKLIWFYIVISSIMLANMVTILVMLNNQQVTNSHLDLVGTSETLRIVSFLLTIIPINVLNYLNNSDEEKRFNEWLAGVIDGSGALLISKDGSISCEITMTKYNEHNLMLIKNKLGGSVKLRSSSNSYRYRLQHKSGMVNLISMINGNIRNSKRIPQLIKICEALNITYIPPIPLTLNNAWFSGFFDSNGTIIAKFDVPSPTITIEVSNKHKIDVEPFLIFNGNIKYNKSGYGHYTWSISSQVNIINMLEYFRKNPLRSHKLAMINLINKFYELRSLKSNKSEPNMLANKRWDLLKTKWSKLEK